MKTKWAIGIDCGKSTNVDQKQAPPFFKGRWLRPSEDGGIRKDKTN
jgi:hypothetical protein